MCIIFCVIRSFSFGKIRIYVYQERTSDACACKNEGERKGMPELLLVSIIFGKRMLVHLYLSFTNLFSRLLYVRRRRSVDPTDKMLQQFEILMQTNSRLNLHVYRAKSVREGKYIILL